MLISRVNAEREAHSRSQQAFGEIVRRFQDLAFACAYSILGDFQAAEDAAQEAFIVAWRSLDQLRTPEAFPGWLKRIVVSRCSRITRVKQTPTVSLETLNDTVSSDESDPYAALEREELKERVYAAVQSLPEHERMVTVLFYINDYSQKEISSFLELPITTIKKRLFNARKRLREKMMDMVRDTLREQRPSRNERFANTVALYNEALESFINKVKQDRYIIAAILFGSLSHDRVWRKSDIDIMLVGREEKPVREFYLVENGINIHASVSPRSKFKQALEGQLQGGFMHSSFARSTLIYTTDETIREYYHNVKHMGAYDRDMRLIGAGQSALYTLAKAEKWLYVHNDPTYCFVWLMYTVRNLAEIEVLGADQVPGREVLQQALEINPELFNYLYRDTIHCEKTDASMQAALDTVNRYLDSRVEILFGPILEFLTKEGGIRTTTEIDSYFKKQVQQSSLSMVYEWLADRGTIQKVPSPVRLTDKSQIMVDEAAYYYDGGPHV